PLRAPRTRSSAFASHHPESPSEYENQPARWRMSTSGAGRNRRGRSAPPHRSVGGGRLAAPVSLLRPHDEDVLEVAKVHGRDEDRSLERSVLALGDLNHPSEHEALGEKRAHLVPEREARGDNDVTGLHVLRLQDPVHDQRVSELPADDTRGTRALNERRDGGA